MASRSCDNALGPGERPPPARRPAHAHDGLEPHGRSHRDQPALSQRQRLPRADRRAHAADRAHPALGATGGAARPVRHPGPRVRDLPGVQHRSTLADGAQAAGQTVLRYLRPGLWLLGLAQHRGPECSCNSMPSARRETALRSMNSLAGGITSANPAPWFTKLNVEAQLGRKLDVDARSCRPQRAPARRVQPESTARPLGAGIGAAPEHTRIAAPDGRRLCRHRAAVARRAAPRRARFAAPRSGRARASCATAAARRCRLKRAAAASRARSPCAASASAAVRASA